MRATLPHFKSRLHTCTLRFGRNFSILSTIIVLATIQLQAQITNNEVLRKYAQTEHFEGVVLIAEKGKITLQEAFGLAERPHQIPMQTNAVFRIASLTKTFTAVMIMQLMEEGKLNLTDPISKIYPSYPGPGRDAIQIVHLLNHTSGIINCEDYIGNDVYLHEIPLDTFIRRYCSSAPEVKPGTRFNYNNGDYIILGRILELVDGKDFETLLNDRILHRLQMEHSGMFLQKLIIPELCETYHQIEENGAYLQDPPMYLENYFAAGAMFSTASDMQKFDQALFSHQLLRPETLQIMMQAYPEFYSVAMGWWVSTETRGGKTYRFVNRQGSIWGANANWMHIPETETCVLILSNTSACNLNVMMDELVNTLIPH